MPAHALCCPLRAPVRPCTNLRYWVLLYGGRNAEHYGYKDGLHTIRALGQGENWLNFLASAPFAFQGERRKWEGYHGQCPEKAVPRAISLSCASGEDEKSKAPKSEKSGCYPVQDQRLFFNGEIWLWELRWESTVEEAVSESSPRHRGEAGGMW